jgi:outer membrane protein TolC
VDLIGRRADLVAARWQVEAAARDIKAVKTEFLPNVSLEALAGFVVLGSGNLLQLPARTAIAGPALTLPVFDGGRLRAKLTANDAAYDQMVARYNGLLIAALNDVFDQVSALTAVRKQIAFEKQARDDALKSWEDAMAAYQGEVSGPLVPLITRQQLLIADQRTAELESEQADISIRLIEALGGGFSVADKAGSVSP